MNALIAELWRKNQPQILERIALLEDATAAACSGTLTEVQRTEAESMSHKLAGSLGMFGFPAGTTIARALEDEFHAICPSPSQLGRLTSELRAALYAPAQEDCATDS